jgi:preprotein translocase subunit SecG
MSIAMLIIMVVFLLGSLVVTISPNKIEKKGSRDEKNENNI